VKLTRKQEKSLWSKLDQLAEKAPWLFVMIDDDGQAHILTNAVPKTARKILRRAIKRVEEGE
jgi:hypothetical protein